MTINDIHDVMTALAAKRRAFWSEADFQFAFAWELQIKFPTAVVHLERRYLNANNEYYYIDIWVEYNEKVFPIELKYKTKAATIGSITLLNHSATDFGCYDYLKDIYRIELISRNVTNFGKGFAIMLTNDAAYYNNTLRVSAYDNFKIYEGTIRGGLLSWGNTAKGTTFAAGSRDDFSLRNSYTMSWNKYNGGIDNFMYLINQI